MSEPCKLLCIVTCDETTREERRGEERRGKERRGVERRGEERERKGKECLVRNKINSIIAKVVNKMTYPTTYVQRLYFYGHTRKVFMCAALFILLFNITSQITKKKLNIDNTIRLTCTHAFIRTRTHPNFERTPWTSTHLSYFSHRIFESRFYSSDNDFRWWHYCTWSLALGLYRQVRKEARSYRSFQSDLRCLLPTLALAFTRR